MNFVSVAIPPTVTVIFASTPGIASMKLSPVMVIFVPPSSLPLGGEILVIVGRGYGL